MTGTKFRFPELGRNCFLSKLAGRENERLGKVQKAGFGKTVLYPYLQSSSSNDCGFSIYRIIDMKGMKS